MLPALAEEGLAGQVKLAYLDVPYNGHRSNRFRGHYRDHRTKRDWADLVGDAVDGVLGLLREDGSLWLHLDATELGTARGVVDKVFGDNFVGQITWERTRRPNFTHAQLSSTTDHILVYGKDRRKLAPFVLGTTEPGKRTPIAHRGNKSAEVRFPPRTVKFGGADGVYPAGDHSSPGIDASLLEDVVMAGGWNLTPLSMRLPSRYSPSKVADLLAAGGEFFIPKQPFRPSFIAPGGKPKVVNNLWSWQLDADMETNEDGAKQQERLFPGRPFPYAKPEGLLRRVIEVASEPDDIVLDCFAGSGTTTAVAKKLGRRWIAVEENPNTVRDYLGPRMRDAL